ncbi:hypothetical protein SAMD00019534_113940 [Acytostelium subglobosum LB1]|uniref:hypothetical protein n=1 Tax=Acytostelium subglobosum LB1 TaxID=1410327 RepID=UPI0006448BDE|nr:hypothetical protein SAMD00019534_113940 [Acytostelium subglobosum LB1]GAM28218.1 hypothetical protein SAMD00019534_113940 [Acytostelium subglobosum LB1]|eukprot:XP_012748852.1 hypothetical protein SAMD00019534_113940 [Acytostelium subglobosum LB1]
MSDTAIHPGDKPESSSSSSVSSNVEVGSKRSAAEECHDIDGKDSKKVRTTEGEDFINEMTKQLGEVPHKVIETTIQAINSGVEYVQHSLQPMIERSKEIGDNIQHVAVDTYNATCRKTEEFRKEVHDKAAHLLEAAEKKASDINASVKHSFENAKESIVEGEKKAEDAAEQIIDALDKSAEEDGKKKVVDAVATEEVPKTSSLEKETVAPQGDDVAAESHEEEAETEENADSEKTSAAPKKGRGKARN